MPVLLMTLPKEPPAPVIRKIIPAEPTAVTITSSMDRGMYFLSASIATITPIRRAIFLSPMKPKKVSTGPSPLKTIFIMLPRRIRTIGRSRTEMDKPALGLLSVFFSATSSSGITLFLARFPRKVPNRYPPITAEGIETISEYSRKRPKSAPMFPATAIGPGVGITMAWVTMRPTARAVT